MNKRSPVRQDGVLIMARGDSRRMGRPKGLVHFPGQNQSFLEILVALYRRWSWPVTVIFKPEDRPEYEPVLRLLPTLKGIHEPGGQDTARTMLAAWPRLRGGLTHLWLHPVDLPLVKEETIFQLLSVSQDRPQRIIRPVFLDLPGHPVIMPARVLDALSHEFGGPPWPSGPVRSMVEQAVTRDLIEPILATPVSDVGVNQDFDSVADFPTDL